MALQSVGHKTIQHNHKRCVFHNKSVKPAKKLSHTALSAKTAHFDKLIGVHIHQPVSNRRLADNPRDIRR